MALRFRPLHETFGAEVIGADLSRELDGPMLAEIEAAWQRHSILLFRDVEMTPAQHVAFTRRLGPLHIMEPLEFNLPGYPEVMVVSNIEKDDKPIGMKRAGWGWHSDGEDKILPNAGSFLYALEAAARRRRHAVCRHLRRVRGAARRRAREDHGTAGVLLPRALPSGLLPAPPAAHRGAEEGASRRLAADRAPSPEERVDLALHRAMGVPDRGHAGRRS